MLERTLQGFVCHVYAQCGIRPLVVGTPEPQYQTPIAAWELYHGCTEMNDKYAQQELIV